MCLSAQGCAKRVREKGGKCKKKSVNDIWHWKWRWKGTVGGRKYRKRTKEKEKEREP